jgi:hypothetical protein
MHKKSKTHDRAPSSFSVGEKAYILFGKKKRMIRILEDRGRIGWKGRRLLRVVFLHPKRLAEESFEIPAEELTGVQKRPRRSGMANSKVA